MQAELPPTFAPLPLRPRGVLEILDAAVKLYKQYFWVLLGWAAIAVPISMIPYLGVLMACFMVPFIVGPVACCIAAAVRGQNVGFRQCWRFTGPRYWVMAVLYVLSGVVAFVIVILLGIMAALLFPLAARLFSGAAVESTIFFGIIGFLLLALILSALMAVVVTWQSLVPFVACMEDDKRNTVALRRAYDLLRGQSMRVIALQTLFGLGMLALLLILMSVGAVAAGLPSILESFNGRADNEAWLRFLLVFGLAYSLVWIFAAPIFYLVIAVLYLDIRVRHEALDLEWTAHTTAPLPIDRPFSAPAIASFMPIDVAPPTNLAPIDPAPPEPPAPHASADAADAADAAISAEAVQAAPQNDSQAMQAATIGEPVEENAPDATAGQTIICPRCGAQEAAVQTFCNTCGARLRTAW